ncbi:MAG: NAD-dependent deacetylase [Rhizobiales bacterium]|nr:NAD-dependent deacetylase [Hyphomicrobiales bacterium]
MTSTANEASKEEFVSALRNARTIVAFTGAGISTECGIPDFRSPGGFWTQHAPIYFDEFVASPAMRIEAWKRKFSMDEAFGAAEPGTSHQVLAHLASIGRLSHVITQNIDNLHQTSGIDAEQVIELHGNTTYATCLDCALRHELDWIKPRFQRDGSPPDCRDCGGLLKTATVSFGQAMPQAAMKCAEAATLGCDLMLVLGSSLVVYPAAGFPVLAKQNGARLVIVNREPTDLDQMADIVINAEIADMLELLAGFN